MKQTEKEKLKRISLSDKYCCSGEMYKLLDTKTFEKIILGLEEKVTKSKNNIYEELFILFFDNYICYIRDTYFIRYYELIKIIEETLKNKYNRYLFDDDSFHINQNGYKFKQLFLENIVRNTIEIAKFDTNLNYMNLQKAYQYLKNKNLDNLDDLERVELLFIKLINTNRDNLYYLFKYENKTNHNFYLKVYNLFYEEINNILD